jgi:hypothetical protein
LGVSLDTTDAQVRRQTLEEEGGEENVPVSPKTTTPPRERFWLPDIFDGFKDLSAEPDQLGKEDDEPTPTQADFLPQQYRDQYHPGGNFFLQLPYPVDSTAPGVLSVPVPEENLLPREKGSANVGPPEMLSPYPDSDWEGGGEGKGREIGASIEGGFRLLIGWQAQLPVRGRGGGIGGA